MSRHECKGEGCGICHRRIEQIEDDRTRDGDDYEYAVLEDREYGRRYEP